MTEYLVEYLNEASEWAPLLKTDGESVDIDFLGDALVKAIRLSDSRTSPVSRIVTPVSKDGNSWILYAMFYRGQRIYWFNEDTEWRLI